MDLGPWRFEKELSQKLQGTVWRVTNSAGQIGYFKFAGPEQWRYSGPFIANEYIAANLARKLHFPVARCRTADVVGPDGIVRHGLVSVCVTAPIVTTWGKVDSEVRNHPEHHVRHLDRLRQLVVFDAWIANVDRATGANTVLYQKKGHSNYNWYLIDHALTLFGAPYKWDKHSWRSSYWEELWRHYHVPNGLLRLQSSWEYLEPMIERIERLTKEEIEHAVHHIPEGSMDDELKSFTTELLLRRQRHLRRIIQRWLHYDGIKEYGNE